MEAEGVRPEPLDRQGWQEAIRKTQSLLPQDADKIALSRALRRAFYLSQLTPDPIRPIFATECAEDSFERLLDAGDLEGAARALLGPGLEVEVSKPDGKLIVVVQASEIGGKGTGISSHPAAAMLEAWVNCISTAVTIQADAEAALNRDLHKSQRGWHPSSTQH